MSREPETNRYPHLSLFVCFCLLVCTEECQAFTCFGFCFVCLLFFWRREVTTLFRALLFLELCCRIPCNWKYTNFSFDRLLNNNQLRNLPSGIFSSNTHLEWPHGCSRINTWTMKCPLKHALVQENLFAK